MKARNRSAGVRSTSTMYNVRDRRDKPTSLLHRYGAQLGRILERNRAEMALLAAKQDADRAAALARSAMVEAQSASRAKTEFLANMSHELRTPLNAIIGFSEMIQDDLLGSNNATKYREYAHDIHDSGRHLLDLINDILDLAKIEAGKLLLHEQRVDVSRVVKSCLTIINERASEAGLDLRYSLPEPCPPLLADERKFKQILINVLSNAVKFTPRGGFVELAVESSPTAGFEARITDTGIGMAPDDIRKATTPFW